MNDTLYTDIVLEIFLSISFRKNVETGYERGWEATAEVSV